MPQNFVLPAPGVNNFWYLNRETQSVIVFVHGILSDSRGCWSYVNKRDPSKNMYWPALIESDLRLADASIYMGGHYTAVDAGPYEIRNCADELFRAMNRIEEHGTAPVMSNERIFFVCHSTGGIVVRYLLDYYVEHFRSKTVGLLLIASPSYGSQWADKLSLISRFYNQHLGIQLKWGNWSLRDLDARFKDLVNNREIPNFIGVEAYENRFIFHRKWLPDRTVVVTEESAGRYFGAPVLLRGADHFGSVKPPDTRHPAHELLVDVWYKFRHLPSPNPLSVPPQAEPAQISTQIAKETTSPPSVLVPSDLGVSPQLDANARYITQFIGREIPLNDVKSAIAGLVSEPKHNGPRLIWLHGFGGLGKSWFIRRACMVGVENYPRVRIGLIDWDSNVWRRPLNHLPLHAQELFDPIAYRVAQVYGGDSLREYWDARTKASASRRQFLDLQYEFDYCCREHIAALAQTRTQTEMRSGDYADPRTERLQRHVSALQSTLQEFRYGLNNAAELAILNESMYDKELRDHLFELWAERVSESEGNEFLIRPSSILAAALRRGLFAVCHANPLVLTLDTCELLGSDMDQVLRNFVVGLLSETEQVLVIIGSRLPPDAGLPAGTRRGWLTEIEPSKRRIIGFGEDFRFSPSEISQLLEMTARPTERTETLLWNIYHVTLGIPLLVRILLDLHDNDDNILEKLSELPQPDADADYRRATQIVSEAITERWLSHLERGSPEDLEAIVALGLLRKANYRILQILWEPLSPEGRIRQLRRRYSLLDSGDLHETVRVFLRRRWRREPHEKLKAVGEKLEAVINQLEPESQEDRPYFAWLIEKLNIDSWLRPEEFDDVFARFTSLALAYEFEIDDFMEIALELGDLNPSIAEIARRALPSRFYLHWFANSDLITWLESHRKKTRWSARELACLDLLCALRLNEMGEAEQIKDRDRWIRVCKSFESALTYFGQDPPRHLEVMKSYLLAAFHATLGASSLDVAERAYQWAASQPNAQEGYWVSIGHVLHNLGRYEEAEGAYQKAWTGDPEGDKYPYLARCRAHVLDHVGRTDEAIHFATLAIEREPSFAYLHILKSALEAKLGRFQDAEASLGDLGRFSDDLSALLTATEMKLKYARLAPGRESEVKELCDKLVVVADELLSTAPQSQEDQNSVAWALYESRTRLERAEDLARRAVANDAANWNVQHTLVSILAAEGKFDELKPHLLLLLHNRYKDGTRWSGADGVRNIVRDLLPKFCQEILSLIDQEQSNLAGDWSALSQALRALVNRETHSDWNAVNPSDSVAVFYDDLKDRFAA